MKKLILLLSALFSLSVLADSMFYFPGTAPQYNVNLELHDVPQGSEPDFEKSILKKLSKKRIRVNSGYHPMATLSYEYEISDQFLVKMSIKIIIEDTKEVVVKVIKCSASNLFTYEYAKIGKKCSRKLAKEVKQVLKAKVEPIYYGNWSDS
ncbi:MAG: hypothetical protein N4A33_05935 [Bacteriovoracaceae bacterium]|jgi:hypothetical protein|nr:hypothetical protein [Bacteriovoracaceae bacterium]